jgi:prophage DNA circulation protein
MNNLIDLKSAKYKGVEFLFEKMSTTGGNRLVKFNYPGSDKQSLEVQGKAPPTFTLNIWIQHENYYQDRDDLLRVLNDGLSGVLVHPTFGDIENVINGQYTLSEQISELGHAKLTVAFELDDAPGIPTQSGNLVAEVQAESDVLNNQLAVDFSEDFKVDAGLVGNFADAVASVEGFVADSISAAKKQIADNPTISSFKASSDSFLSSVNTLVQLPSSLAGQVSSTFAQLDSLYTGANARLAVFTDMFSFGDDDVAIRPTTAGRIQRKRNRVAMQTVVKTQALSYAYVSAGEIEYASTDDLDKVQSQLEDQYLSIRDSSSISNESLEQLDRVRVQALKTLDLSRVNTRSIVTVDTDQMPLSVLAFNYYGNTDLVDQIAALNNISQNAFVEGQVRILTA